MKSSTPYDVATIGLRILLGGRLTISQRRAGFMVLATDMDKAAAVASVWLVRHLESPDAVEYALVFERLGSWCCRGWSESTAQDRLLAGRPSVSDQSATVIDRVTGSSCPSWLGWNMKPETYDDWLRTAPWVGCTGYRLAAEAKILQLGGRIISIPDHGYVIAAWRSPARLTGSAITVSRADGTPLARLGPNEPISNLDWQQVLEALGDES